MTDPDFFQRILFRKRMLVDEHKSLYPVKLLEKSISFSAPPVSLKKYLQRPDKSGIIAEFKRKSPSRGILNAYASVERTSIGYMQAGASALSVLTDQDFFGGSMEDLATARKFNFCPILQKDFILDEYQIIEAKSVGADAILLIAAALETETLQAFTHLAHSLGMEVVLEVHDESEIRRTANIDADIIGVNNRDLKTFHADVFTSQRLAALIPADRIKISESGITSPEIVFDLKRCGYHGFLIGESFMAHARPETAAQEFIGLISLNPPGSDQPSSIL